MECVRYTCISICEGTLRVILFFFNDTATTEIYTLSLHDALPICVWSGKCRKRKRRKKTCDRDSDRPCPFVTAGGTRSEEHTSELQSRLHLVFRLLLAKTGWLDTTPLRNTWHHCSPAGVITTLYYI